ncbi:MAG: MipA/OmpV family protein [Thiothrix sp.]|nr:MAG: MipA/OmpV family protein [Thiothrix sp.]
MNELLLHSVTERHQWLRCNKVTTGLISAAQTHKTAIALRSNMKFKLSFILAASLMAGATFAGDIAKDIREGGGYDRSNSNYFELGVHYIDSTDVWVGSDNDDCKSKCKEAGFDLSASGAYYFKGAFIELESTSFDGLSLGFNFLNTEHWSLDLLGSSASGSLNDDPTPQTDEEKDQALLNRDTFYNGAGIRATAYWNDIIFQYRLVTDIYDSNGITSSARLGKSWQAKNWNFHAILSTDYFSNKTTQYLIGVTKEEATDRFAQYNPKGGLIFTADIGATYPLSEHLVWRSFFRHTELPDRAKDSPLIEDNRASGFSTSINYVF